MSQRLLTVDVGNSRIKFGLFDRHELVEDSARLPTCLQSAVIAVDEAVPWRELRDWTALSPPPQPPPSQGGEVQGRLAGLSGVVAGANPAGVERILADWPAEWPTPTVIHDPQRFPLRIAVDEPSKVGIDRLLNSVSVNVIRPAGRPAIIVDTGTATTVDYVTADGTFAGGAILPGFELSARSLHRYTALLPLISMEELSREPSPLGRNTRDALRSGLYWGQLGAVRELVRRLSENTADSFVVLTGGAAPLLQPHWPEARREPHLASQGLALVADFMG